MTGHPLTPPTRDPSVHVLVAQMKAAGCTCNQWDASIAELRPGTLSMDFFHAHECPMETDGIARSSDGGTLGDALLDLALGTEEEQ